MVPFITSIGTRVVRQTISSTTGTEETALNASIIALAARSAARCVYLIFTTEGTKHFSFFGWSGKTIMWPKPPRSLFQPLSRERATFRNSFLRQLSTTHLARSLEVHARPATFDVMRLRGM